MFRTEPLAPFGGNQLAPLDIAHALTLGCIALLAQFGLVREKRRQKFFLENRGILENTPAADTALAVLPIYREMLEWLLFAGRME